MRKRLHSLLTDELYQNIALCIVCGLVYTENWVGFLL